MNRNANSAIYFTAGLCIGGGAAYLFAKKKYRLLAEEEIASVKEVFQAVRAEAKQADKEVAPVKAPEGDFDPVVDAEIHKAYRKHIESEEYDHYKDSDKPEKVAQVRVDIHDDDFEVDVVVDLNEKDEADGEPYRISIEDFHGERDTFEKLSLTYWDEDDTLAGEDEKVIDDRDALIGKDALAPFSSDPDEPNELYVRNEHLEADFEIIRDPRSFHKVVLGINDWDEPKVKDKHKIKKMKMRGDG